MPQDRDIKTICDEILYRVGELAGLAIKADIESTKGKKFAELYAENARLKVDLLDALSHCKAVDEVNEKMKCCGNCKHYVADNCDLQCPHNCYNYDEWELKI